MEKYSAYRDPGTGIQPFLYPVPPQGSGSLATILKPITLSLGLIRTAFILILAILYLILVPVLCTLFKPITPIYNLLSSLVTFLILRLCLLFSGLYWISVEVVKRKRGRTTTNEKMSVRAGDIIVSNWISWLEIAWLVCRYNPVFALPNFASGTKPSLPSPSLLRKPIRGTKGTVSDSPSQAGTQRKQAELCGFTKVGFLQLVSKCGLAPPYVEGDYQSLEQIRLQARKAGRPLVIFPECTTSNGRGLLRFENVFKGVTVPIKHYNIFIMCVRINPPTNFSPSLSLPIPFHKSVNPLPHIFRICSSFAPYELSIRFLAPSESPGSETFVTSDFSSSATSGDDALTEICATLMSDIGRFKRTGMGWEDKSLFLDFYEGKNGKQ